MGRLLVSCCCCIIVALGALSACPSLRWKLLASLAAPVPFPSPRPDAWWRQLHEKYVKEVEEADEGEGFEVIFYGDSITESWRGTDMSGPCLRCEGVPEVFEKYFGRWRSHVLAIGGDQTAHLAWRVANGELPKTKPARVAVILIGTNDLGAALDEGEPGVIQASDGAIMRILHMVRYLRDESPTTHLLLMGLLPRGGPNPHYRYREPNIFTESINRLNWRLKSLTNVDSHLHFVDCSDPFVASTPHGGINPELMPDALHPSKEGYERLGECLEPAIMRLMRGDPGKWVLGGRREGPSSSQE